MISVLNASAKSGNHEEWGQSYFVSTIFDDSFLDSPLQWERHFVGWLKRSRTERIGKTKPKEVFKISPRHQRSGEHGTVFQLKLRFQPHADGGSMGMELFFFSKSDDVGAVLPEALWGITQNGAGLDKIGNSQW